MKFLVTLALALVAGALASGPEVLTDETFDAAIASGDTYFVKFYAPWCGHCKRLAPIWKELADEVPAKGINAKVAKVDCTVSRDACSSNNIRGYPTVLLFKGGNKEGIRYSGPREVASFVDFLQQQTAPAAASE